MNAPGEPLRLRNAIRYQSIADVTADSLRRMILLGELAPGSRVTQDELSALLGVSTMPVREALLRLAADGLIETFPNRSFRVVSLRESDIRDVYWVQGKVSGELTRRSCDSADVEFLGELHALQRDMDRAHDEDNAEMMETCNWRFHRAINRRAGSPRLLLLLQRTLRYVPLGLYSRVPEWRHETIRGHNQILHAFDRGDSAAAGAEAEQHVVRAGELLVQTFFDRGHWRVDAAAGTS